MPIMSKQLEDDFKICIDRVIESRYEDDKINCCIMDLKSKVLREMATSSNNKYTAPQATPKSCPKCSSESILKNEKHSHYGCLKCHHEWA